uniref:Protein AATF n=1 Tax=Romanomermis culicivorax TaxID=13658 RepID=A0A915HLU2_ROMCU
MSLVDQLKNLTNPAPVTFHPDEEDECDVTRAALADKCDETSGKNPKVKFGSIRHRSALLLGEKYDRYKGTVTGRKVLSSDVEELSDSDRNDDYLNDDQKSGTDEQSSNDSDSASLLEENENENDEFEDEDINNNELKSSEDEEDESGLIKTFAHVDINSEHSKAKAVQNQLSSGETVPGGMWEQLLATRIRLQRVVASINLLPQSEHDWSYFIKSSSNSEFALRIRESKNRLKSVIDRLIHFQNRLWLKNDQTKALAIEQSASVAVDSDLDIPSSPEGTDFEEHNENTLQQAKTTFKICEYPNTLEKRRSNFVGYRNKVLLHWFDKTKLASGRVLSDHTRLTRRTHLKRSDYQILGKRKFSDCNADEQEENEDEYDEEVFDDDDFYHQLLREVVENKTSNETDPHVLGRQWLEVQKFRNKAKKKLVDRKASKARKIRYDVMPKLTNFMAPTNNKMWSDEARYVIMENKAISDSKPSTAAAAAIPLKDATKDEQKSDDVNPRAGGRKKKMAADFILKLESYFFEHTSSRQPDWFKTLVDRNCPENCMVFSDQLGVPIHEISKMDPHFPTLCPALRILLRKYGNLSKIIEIDDKVCMVRQRPDSLKAIDCGLFIICLKFIPFNEELFHNEHEKSLIKIG